MRALTVDEEGSTGVSDATWVCVFTTIRLCRLFFFFFFFSIGKCYFRNLKGCEKENSNLTSSFTPTTHIFTLPCSLRTLSFINHTAEHFVTIVTSLFFLLLCKGVGRCPSKKKNLSEQHLWLESCNLELMVKLLFARQGDLQAVI